MCTLLEILVVNPVSGASSWKSLVSVSNQLCVDVDLLRRFVR